MGVDDYEVCQLGELYRKAQWLQDRSLPFGKRATPR